MKPVAKLVLAALALATLATPASANWRHHRHVCGWGGKHHLRC